VSTVHTARCLNHRDREAAARCPSCKDYFCRECVTEHEGRVMCARCLAALAGGAGAKDAGRSFTRPILAFIAFAFVVWFFFLLGRTLLMLPDAFHDGAFWTGSGR
jgi:hypothetical protein